MLNAATFAEWLSVTIARTLKLASANVQTHSSSCSDIHVPFSLVSGEALTTMGKVFCKPQTKKTTMPLYKFPSLSAPIYSPPEYLSSVNTFHQPLKLCLLKLLYFHAVLVQL